MLFGLELEYFVINKKDAVVVPRAELAGFLDGGGVLVEARGEPQKHPELALASLKLAQKALFTAVRRAKRWPMLANEAEITPASMRYAQSHKKSFNPDVIPFERFRNPVELTHPEPGRYRAGLHVHFSQPYVTSSGSNIYQPFDMVYPIRLLDQEFGNEIALAGRLPGAYRIKPYGFEYRSLPATVDQKKLVKVLCKMLAPREFEMYPTHQIPDDEDDL